MSVNGSTLILWYKLYSFFKTVPRSRSHSFYGTSYAHSLRLYLGAVSHSFYGTSYTHSLRLYLGAVSHSFYGTSYTHSLRLYLGAVRLLGTVLKNEYNLYHKMSVNGS
jgi:hypothetical protein